MGASTPIYADARSVVSDVSELLMPPRRISVSECARDVIRIESPGGYAGPWDASLTPYMIEPMDTLKSRRHEAVVFVSPARAGKTQALLDAWVAHAVTADPGDMGLYFATQTLAYDYRKRRLERLHRHSPQMRDKLSQRSHDTTIEMVTYRHGMILNLGWPSSSQLAQRDLRYVALSDYDSFPDDIAGEGSAFDLARKRIQVAMSAGMALVESSPKRSILTAQWQPDGCHQAPPVAGGILPLYNRGDRRRWYWRCIIGCGESFEAPAMPRYDDLPDIGAAAASAHVCCPHCGQIYRPNDKPALNASGRWITEAEREGREPDATIASYWLLGCAAAFQAWPSIVRNYLTALREFEAGGDEAALRATTNTDQGMPYLARKLSDVRGVEHLGARLESSERYVVPAGVRVLIAAVDVQANRFEVAIWGYGLGGERWLVDRYAITEHNGAKLQPAVFTEHWDALTERVVYGTYQLGGERELRIYRTFVDSGGYHSKKDRADSTARAHEWWRRLRTDGLAHRARLIKGAASRTAPLIKESLPDTRKRRDRSGSRGDVPMVFLNVDALKDGLASDLARDVAGPGYVHLPRWITRKHLDELNAEQRTPKGWEVIQGRRNETWDLAVYAHACWLWLGGPRLTESAAPGWFAEPESNVEAITKDQRRDMKAGASPVKRRRSSWL